MQDMKEARREDIYLQLAKTGSLLQDRLEFVHLFPL